MRPTANIGIEPEPHSDRVARQTVLLVEDEVLVRVMLGDAFRDAGFRVIESANADDALAVLHSGTHVDAIISDVNMPGSINGIGLARLARAELPQAKIVLTSAHLDSVIHVEHDGFVPKPYDLHRLVGYVCRLTIRVAD